MPKKWLIDAYNLMHKIPPISRLLENNPGEARRYLMDALSVFCQNNSRTAHVVFDGAAGSENIKRKNLSIAYSHNKKADDLIISLLSKKNAQKKWIVITDDNEILQKARIYGVENQSSSGFAKRLNLQQKQPSKSRPKPLQKNSDVIVSDKEVDEMLLFYKLKNRDDK